MIASPPAWPSSIEDADGNDARAKYRAALEELALYVQEEMGTVALESASDFWAEHLAPEHRLSKEEQALMIADFEETPRRWQRVAKHLSSGRATPRYLELVSQIIENGGFHPNSRLDDQHGAQHLAQAQAYYEAIGIILTRAFPEHAADKDSSQHIKKMTAKLCRELWENIPHGKAGITKFEKIKERFSDPKINALRSITHAVYFGPTK